jgi:hypothetical protein
MHAVDAAIGPEIQHNNLSAQLCHAQWPASIEPVEPGGEFWRRGVAGKRTSGHLIFSLRITSYVHSLPISMPVLSRRSEIDNLMKNKKVRIL